MDTTDIATTIDTTMQEIKQLFSAFSEAQVNIVPFEGSWTAGQLVKHLTISGLGFSQLVNGAVKGTERPPGENIETIRNVFLDYTRKLKSPEFVAPPLTDFNRDELLGELEQIRGSLTKAARELDLEKTCTGIELPALGMLTRLEAIYFVNYHTVRHTRQLAGIYEKIVQMG